jgi:protein farnesyltransferase/geranylgeranyltransferase type-1 subunit alpha
MALNEDVEIDIESIDGVEEEEDWTDVIPIQQDDGPHPIVPIAYTAEFKQLMGLFRAVVFSGERSKRVLRLTEDLLELNAANYTVWQYRRDCLKETAADLMKEVKYMDDFADENPKNYQIWFHRRAVVELLGNGSQEKAFTERVFELDAKNYHAWAHRQWAISKFGLWEGEIAFVETLIEQDLRNNSAWNQRWFAVHCNPNEPVTMSIVRREWAYTANSIQTVANNESSWNYLRGLLNHHAADICDEGGAETNASKLEDLLSTLPAGQDNPLALALLADTRQKEGTEEALEVAEALVQRLVEVDQIRAKSWLRRGETIRITKFRLTNNINQ